MLTLLDLIWADFRLLRETGSELLDRSLPPEKQQQIKAILATYEPQGIQFHALRTRVAASQQFVTFHVLVPGSWTVQQGHQLCEEIELAIAQAPANTHVMTHLEPLEDPRSWQDQDLHRQV